MSQTTRPVRRFAVIAAEKISQHYYNNNNNNNNNNNKRKRNEYAFLSSTVTTTTNSKVNTSTNNFSSSSSSMKRHKRDNGQLKRSARHSGLPQPGLSFELWQIILKDLVPSQLAIVAQVSNGMAAIVRGLVIWKTIAETANLGLPVTRGIRRTYFGVVLVASSRVCENCFTKCKPSGSQAALPVFVQEQNKQVRMCIKCRKVYFDKHPELLVSPAKTTAKTSSSSSSSAAAAEVEVEDDDDDDDDLDHLDRVILRHYGGRVGVEAERRKQRAMSETRAKNQQIRQEQRRVELMQRLSELGIWYDPESSMAFQRYIIRGKPNLETVIQGLVEEADMHREQEARQQELETRLKHALAELLVDQDDGYEDGGEEKSQQQRVTEYITTLRDCIVYIQFGLPEQLDQVVEAVVERARQDQERETRRKKLEAKLTALKLEEYITSYECITYIHSDQPEDVEHVIHAIAERERERQERVETIARRRKELTDRLEEENIYHVFGHIEHQIAMLWMEIESIISNAKREAADQKAKEDRRRVLEERLRENEVELREDSAICTSYINHGTGNLDDVVTRMTELAWYFRETNYGAIRHGVHGRLYYKRVSLEQYIRERLSSMKFGPVSHDPDTLARPPPSLWSTIKVLEFKEWKEHARACMVEGLVRTSNITVKEIIRQQLESTNVLNSAHLAGIVTNEVLVAAMDEGAVALAKIPSSSSSTSASSSSITTSTRSFSSALREMLGDVTFSIFVESYRLPAVSNVRKRLFDEQVSTSAAVSNPGASSNVQQHTNNTANDSNVASDNDNNEDVPMPDAPYTTE